MPKRLRNNQLINDSYARRFTAQGKCCAICERPQKAHEQAFARDHCHKTGRMRGVLCRNCNLALGLFQDNPDFLRAAAIYVELHNGVRSPDPAECDTVNRLSAAIDLVKHLQSLANPRPVPRRELT